MGPKTLAAIATAVNFILAVLKIVVGWWANSIALLAEGLHSGLDILSSAITFLGIKIAQKPADEKHPYGHDKFEALASFFIVLLLAVSALGILWEAGERIFFQKEAAHFTLWGIGVMAFSTLINEAMARWKFKVGTKYASLSLISDAEHSRADVIASLGILIGLFLVKFFPLADSILAILVAFYILYESYELSKEAIDSLVDAANPELKKKIEDFLRENNFAFSEVKTRRIGPHNFAEIFLLCQAQEKMARVSKIVEDLKQKILARFPELKQVSLIVQSHHLAENVARPSFGKIFCWSQENPFFRLPKKGWRVVIPWDKEKDQEAREFGSPYFLVLDYDKEKKDFVLETVQKNPFYQATAAPGKGRGRGGRFVKACQADKVFTSLLGENAKNNLKAQGIDFQVIPPRLSREEIKELIKKEA